MKNILLVDDESSLIMSMADGLESQGDQFRVYTANNGKEAVETLETKPVDLVVTDLRMPEMDGFELLAYINDNRPSTPTIVMSAFATPRIEDKLKELGALQVLSKPLDFERLSEAIKQGLNHVFQGGSLAGISVGSFLQLMEAEQKTSLLEVLSEDKQKGFFYLDEGQLHDAVCGDMQGESAAIEMLTWKGAQIRFRSLPEKKLKKNIHQGLMSLLMEASHLEDERAGAEAGPPKESLGGPDDFSLDAPDDLSLENVGEDGDESVLSDDLSLDAELGADDVVSGDLGEDDVSWLVEDLSPEEDATVVEKVPGAEEKTLFDPSQEEEDIAISEDGEEDDDSDPGFAVDSLGADDGGVAASASALEDDSDLFDINDTSLEDDGDLFASDGEEDDLFEVEDASAEEGGLFDVSDSEDDGDLFDVEDAGEADGLYTVEEEAVTEDNLFAAEEGTSEAGDSGDLFAVEGEPGEGDGLSALEDESVEDMDLPGMDEDQDSGDLFAVEEEAEDDGLFAVEEESGDEDGLFALEEDADEDGLFDVEEDASGDDGLFDVEEDASGDDGLFDVEEDAPGDDGLFDVEEDASDDDGLFEVEDVPEAEESSEIEDMSLDFDVDSDAAGELMPEDPAQEEMASVDDDAMFALDDQDDGLEMPGKEDSGGLFELEDDGLEDDGDDDGLYDLDEMPDGDFSEPEDSDDDLDFGGLSDSDEDSLEDDGLPDLDMELPDEVPTPPPIVTAPAPRAIPPMDTAKKDDSAATVPGPVSVSGKMTEEQVARIKAILKDMADEIEGVRVCAISGMDGIGLAEHNPKGVDVQAFGGKFAVVMQLIGKSAQDLNIGQFQENLVQTENAWVLTRFLNPEYYLVIAVGRESTLGNVRMVVSKYSRDLDSIFRA